MDHETAPLILEIKGNSLDDGPGIRSGGLLQGMPPFLRLVPQPGKQKGRCRKYHLMPAYASIAGPAARSARKMPFLAGNRYYIDRKKCTLCFVCVEACPSGALDRVGKEMSVDRYHEKGSAGQALLRNIRRRRHPLGRRAVPATWTLPHSF